MQAKILSNAVSPCPYFGGRNFLSEHFLARVLAEEELDTLLSMGYRHFGSYFFRPVCRECHSCVPIRVPAGKTGNSSRKRRLFNRNSRFQITAGTGDECTEEMFALYLKHKRRFSPDQGRELPGDTEDSFHLFRDSFRSGFSFSKILKIKDEGKLIGVCHFDETPSSLSAVYSYYDDSYRRESLGTYLIFLLAERAKERGAENLYLGYFIHKNKHMRYKADFKPNQVLTKDFHWRDCRTEKGEWLISPEKLSFVPGLNLLDLTAR